MTEAKDIKIRCLKTVQTGGGKRVFTKFYRPEVVSNPHTLAQLDAEVSDPDFARKMEAWRTGKPYGNGVAGEVVTVMQQPETEQPESDFENPHIPERNPVEEPLGVLGLQSIKQSDEAADMIDSLSGEPTAKGKPGRKPGSKNKHKAKRKKKKK